MLFFKVPDADEALLVKGYRVKGDFQVVTGGAVFAVPPLRRVTKLPLGVQDVAIEQTCYEQQGIELVVNATVSFKVEDPQAAGERWGSHPERMLERVERLFGDRLARVAGGMTIEEIAISSREQFAADTIELAAEEMGKAGLVCDGLAITSLDDHGEGYLHNLGAVQRAKMTWAAIIARREVDEQAIGALNQGGHALLSDGRQLGEAAEDAIKQQFSEYAEPTGNGG